LLKSFKLSARTFSELLGEKPTLTQNYVGSRNSMPGADYLEKILKQFDIINPVWLLTGEGEPLLGNPPTLTSLPLTTTTRIKKVTGGAVHSGTGNQLITLEACQQELENTKRDMATAQKEIALLTSQLADKERTIQILLKQTS
jgi:hypothetical protein